MNHSNERPHPGTDHDAFEVQSALLGSAGTPLQPSRGARPGWLASTRTDTHKKRLASLLWALLMGLAGLGLVIALVCFMPSLGAFFLH